MLPPVHRLRRSADFGRTVRRGARAGRTTVVVHVLAESQEQAPPQVGFVVSRAVGNAVQRNLVKRRLREIVRPLVSTFGDGHIPERSSMVVRALPAASTATFAELRHDVAGALARAAARATTAKAV